MTYSICDLRRDIRSPYAWPGGYPMYFVTSDGAALSFATVRANLRNILEAISGDLHDGWQVVAADVNWEDTFLTCSHSGELIPSAYGDD